MAVGRPREFEPEHVEREAMKLFWERGFDGVSISDVTAATGVHRRSIYAEFGSKEKLFERATLRYLAGPGGYLTDALAEPTARAVARGPHGCLTVGNAPGLPELRDSTVHRIAKRFDAAVADGDLPAVDTLVLARWIAAVCQGLALAGWPQFPAD
ncbi:TetR/AcrR family transcriptional regulator [Mycobacterium sp. SMC-8]|uniref:TetR/AcrR family transcriptional regulator n=1 Tax=Mycobacterium sp. SMC-8 TaxID=2857060 RepID=UPI0021B37263|nr:TetR/AcrR family transcriptional regulator [Mycobacterium sp. SMC-8]UXA13491.1 TetR/AcrR family transcriptional regulator [Mycobacterium sp. SMC-8]